MHGFDEPRPLSAAEVKTLLRGIADPPPSISPELAIEALHATADHLRTWCSFEGGPSHAAAAFA